MRDMNPILLKYIVFSDGNKGVNPIGDSMEWGGGEMRNFLRKQEGESGNKDV